MKTIRGTRTCPICRGIVHGKVLCIGYGTSKHRYFDSDGCARRYLENDAGYKVTDEEWEYYKAYLFKPVEVVA